MEVFDLGRILAVAKEVGIMTVTVVVSIFVIVLVFRVLAGTLTLLGGAFKSSDSRWTDIIKVLQEQLVVQREGNKNIADLTLTMQAGFNQERTFFDDRIDALEKKIDEMREELQRVLLLVGEEKADG